LIGGGGGGRGGEEEVEVEKEEEEEEEENKCSQRWQGLGMTQNRKTNRMFPRTFSLVSVAGAFR